MADFDPQVPDQNAPLYTSFQYLRATEPARMQPLAQSPRLNAYPIEARPPVDASTATGVKEAGGLADAALKLTDNVIKQHISNTLQTGLSSIRDNYVSAQAAALGNNPAQGQSLQPPQDKTNLPGPVQLVQSRLRALQAGYQQGVFSDSAYYGKLDSYVKQIKAQFPGYSQNIDEDVRQVVGTTPANALRAAQQQQLNKINTLLLSQQNKQETWERENSGYITMLHPSYFLDKAAGKPIPSFAQLETDVGKQKAVELNMQSQGQALGLMTKQDAATSQAAGVQATQRLTGLAQTMQLSATNSMGLKTLPDFQRLFDARVAANKPFTPEEKTQVSMALDQLIQQYHVQAEKIMSTPLSAGKPDTYTSYINDPAKRAAIIQQGEQPLLNMKQALDDGHFGLFSHDTIMNAGIRDSALNSFLRSDKAIPILQAGRTALGDQFLSTMQVLNPQLNTHVLQAFTRLGVMNSATPGNGHSLSDTFNIYRNNNIMNPVAWKAAVDNSVRIITDQKDLPNPETAKTAVINLYGPKNSTLVDGFKASPGSQLVFFQSLVNPEVTKAIRKMDGQSQAMYYNFANEGFQSVLGNQAAVQNGYAESWHKSSSGLEMSFDPKTNHFEYQMQHGLIASFGRQNVTQGMLRAANANLLPLNATIDAMKSVWEAEGKNPAQELYRLMPTIGIYPHSPMYNAIESHQPKLPEGSPEPQQGEPNQ